ncbi:MinD/ParA family protein [Mesobacillus foraminis]|uniref:Flagellar biosynthesis protein FlhG n=1 Tax=Mesobacillus foraminis TaxID=279826 RepID=A0A4R2BF57_9BACI|nr:MinD/ParA family protein [Mesobacillus foraminis]TCN25601.1 flagellar biosynthesis protein FlhG [Mesobacillus foraminis]
MDQANQLRERLREQASLRTAKTIAVISGKGGVGKSNISLNFSIGLKRKGYRILLFDLDIGMGNIEILMGRSSPLSIADYFAGTAGIRDLFTEGPEGIQYISGGTGLNQLVKLDSESVSTFIDDLKSVWVEYDYVIFDMGAGMNEETMNLLLAVNEMIVVTTPEPTAIMDAYAAIKYIHMNDRDIPFSIIVNRARPGREGRETLDRLEDVLVKFLGKKPVKLGVLPEDTHVFQAVRKQVPFILECPKAPITQELETLIARFENRQSYQAAPEHFFVKLKRLFEKKWQV